jgi:hypothetical protein
MRAIKPCLGCGQEMHGRWSHICPQCGRAFAASTPRQVAIQLGISIAVAIVVVAALVAILWVIA